MLLTWMFILSYTTIYYYHIYYYSGTQIEVAKGGGGKDHPPVFFQKLEKSVLIWRKNDLIVVIYG